MVVLVDMRVRLRYFVNPADFYIRIAPGYEVIAHIGHRRVLTSLNILISAYLVGGFVYQVLLIVCSCHLDTP